MKPKKEWPEHIWLPERDGDPLRFIYSALDDGHEVQFLGPKQYHLLWDANLFTPSTQLRINMPFSFPHEHYHPITRDTVRGSLGVYAGLPGDHPVRTLLRKERQLFEVSFYSLRHETLQSFFQKLNEEPQGYNPERDGTLDEYLSRFRFPMRPVFRGYQPFQALWNGGYIQPFASTLRVLWSEGKSDEHYGVGENGALHGIEAIIHAGKAGVHDPRELLASLPVPWEITTVPPQFRKAPATRL